MSTKSDFILETLGIPDEFLMMWSDEETKRAEEYASAVILNKLPLPPRPRCLLDAEQRMETLDNLAALLSAISDPRYASQGITVCWGMRMPIWVHSYQNHAGHRVVGNALKNSLRRKLRQLKEAGFIESQTSGEIRRATETKEYKRRRDWSKVFMMKDPALAKKFFGNHQFTLDYLIENHKRFGDFSKFYGNKSSSEEYSGA